MTLKRAPLRQAIVSLVASDGARRRIRLLQWLIAGLVYAGATSLMLLGLGQGWMSGPRLLGLSGFLAAVLVTSYAALRSGWSERFSDPSLTLWQLSIGVIAVAWGYLICGPMRTSSLFPLMVIFAFAAYSLQWRQIAFLAAFAVGTLLTAVALRHAWPGLAGAASVANPLQVDIYNVLMILVVLPALAVVAARLSSLRSKLRAQKTALAAALGEVQRLATSDELTGAPNRRSMVDALTAAASRTAHGGPGFCVALLDLDRFKQVNDELGHAKGDEVLRQFALEAAATTRGTDMFGRWGGEEFLVLLTGLSLVDARRAIERLQERVRATVVVGRPVTFSAGIATHRIGEDVSITVARADDAMYVAKGEGRNAVRVEPDVPSGNR